MDILITEQQSFLLRRLYLLDSIIRQVTNFYTLDYDISDYQEFLNDIIPTCAQAFLNVFSAEEQLGDISEMELWKFLCRYIRENYEPQFKKIYEDLSISIYNSRVGDINDD